MGVRVSTKHAGHSVVGREGDGGDLESKSWDPRLPSESGPLLLCSSREDVPMSTGIRTSLIGGGNVPGERGQIYRSRRDLFGLLDQFATMQVRVLSKIGGLDSKVVY